MWNGDQGKPTVSSSLWEQDAWDRIVLGIPRTVEKRGSEITMQQRPAAAALLGRIPLRSRRRYRRDEIIGGGSGVAAQISAGVTDHFRSRTVGGLTVYDLTRPRS